MRIDLARRERGSMERCCVAALSVPTFPDLGTLKVKNWRVSAAGGKSSLLFNEYIYKFLSMLQNLVSTLHPHLLLSLHKYSLVIIG